jgi:hypothetical protein
MAMSDRQARLLSKIAGPTDEVTLWPEDNEWRVGRPPKTPNRRNPMPITADLLELLQMGAVKAELIGGFQTARITTVGAVLLESHRPSKGR